MMMKILGLNGPNINFLGIREKEIYGSKDYNNLLEQLEAKGKSEDVTIDVFQSNSEGEMIDRIQEAYYDGTDGIVINPGAYTHYSYGIRDALASITVTKIEVHISNIHTREEFRRTSVTAPVCNGQITGLGFNGYMLAVDAILDMLKY